MKKISLFGSKSRIFEGVFIFALSVSFCACSVFSNLEVPEKISVKTDAKFSVALGEKSVDMNDIFGEGLQKSISSAEDLDVFTYVPNQNDDTLQYLLHSNIYNFDLDIGEMLGGLNMDEMLSGEDGIEVDEKIQIPKVESPKPREWDDLNKYLENGKAPGGAKTEWQIDQSIKFGEVKCIKTAVVKNNASIEIKVAKPDGTNGISLDLASLTISGAGLDFTKADFETVKNDDYLLFQKLDFAELKEKDNKSKKDRRTLNFSQGDIKIEGIINVNIAAGATCSGLSTEIKVDMKEIEEAWADFSELVDFNNNGSEFPENMLKCVGNVTFGEEKDGAYYKHKAEGEITNTKSEGVGIKCETVNSLPEGNDIYITITSKAFNITPADSKDWKIQSTGNENSRTESWCVFKPIDFGKLDSPSMDFEIKPSNERPLKNLEFGKEYSFSIKNSQFVFDWDSADVKLDALTTEKPIGDYKELSSFSKETLFGDLDGELGEFIKNNIEFGDNIKAYFYAQKPDSNNGLDIDEIKLGGEVKMTYTLNEISKENKKSLEDAELSSAMKWKPNEKKEFTTDLEKTKPIAKYDMSEVLKDGVKDLKIEYNLEIGGGQATKVYKLALDNLDEGSSTSISIDAAIVFPLELKIKKDATLDILKVADFDEDKKDLFERESGSDADYADYLDYIRFEYNLKNKVIEGFDFKIEIDDRPEEQGYSGIQATFDNKKMQFSADDTKKILANLFMPKILLKFDEEKDTNIKILRSGLAGEQSFSFSPVIAIKLNGDSPISITDILY